MNALPIDVLNKIIAAADHNDRIILRGVNRTFRMLIPNDKEFIVCDNIPHEIFIELMSNVENINHYLNADFFYEVIQSENIANILWLLDNGCPIDQMGFRYIASYYDLDLIQRFHQAGCHLDANIFEEIAKAREDTTHILDWLRATGCPSFPNIIDSAARGHLNNLKWFCRTGIFLWNENTFAAAVYSDIDNYEKFEWLIMQGCPMDFRVMITAAINGRIELLDWFYQCGCPCSPEIVTVAARRIRFPEAVLEWFRQRGLLAPAH